MTETVSNFASSTLNGGINNSTLTIVLTDGSTFPSTGTFRIRIDDELIACASRSGATITASTRGVEGTAAASHSTAASVYGVITAAGLDAYIIQEAASAVQGGQITGTVGNATIANTHGTSGTTSHHAQTHAVADHTTAVNVSDEGVSQGAALTLDFVGSGVSAAVSSGTATVTVTSGGAGGSPPFFPAYVVASTDMPASIAAIADASCDGTADEVQINTAIDNAAPLQSRNALMPATAKQRGRVLLTGGRFTLNSPILLRTAVDLAGMGWGTDIRPRNSAGYTDAGASNGTQGALIKLATVSEHLCGVHDVYLYGNYATSAACQHGIYFYGLSGGSSEYPSSSPDPDVYLYQMFIDGFSGGSSTRNGIYMEQNFRGTLCHDIQVRNIRNDALYWLSSPDSFISGIHVGTVGFTGFHIAGGNIRVTNCKAYYCDQYGFWNSSGRNQFAACEVQDSAAGFFFDGAPSVASSITADTCSSVGVMVGDNRVQIHNFEIFLRAGGRYATQAVGLDVDAARTDCSLMGVIDPSNITAPIGTNVATRLPVTGRNFARVSNGSGVAIALSVG